MHHGLNCGPVFGGLKDTTVTLTGASEVREERHVKGYLAVLSEMSGQRVPPCDDRRLQGKLQKIACFVNIFSGGLARERGASSFRELKGLSHPGID